jgi:hypothetical protein
MPIRPVARGDGHMCRFFDPMDAVRAINEAAGG